MYHCATCEGEWCGSWKVVTMDTTEVRLYCTVIRNSEDPYSSTSASTNIDRSSCVAYHALIAISLWHNRNDTVILMLSRC